MKIYWSAKQIPELAGLSASQRTKVLRECRLRDAVTFGFRIFFFGLSLSLGKRVADSMQFGLLGSVICCAIAGAVGGLIVGAVHLTRLRPRIKQYLDRHGDELKTT
jgi:hypothetical protein